MAKIIMLGTGNGSTIKLYNTCFVIENNNQKFLIDTGGSIEIVKRLNDINISVNEIKNIFISHSHSDHIMGIFWIFKKLFSFVLRGEITEKINIYCNNAVYTAIREISKYILPNKVMNSIYEVVNFVILDDNVQYKICGLDFTFFDIKAKSISQYGFETKINNQRVVFLGDETLNPELYDKVRDADYVMHEAFCLDSEKDDYLGLLKTHCTTKSVSEVMNKLNVKNLILYHTEESHGEDRKRLYTSEALEHFDGKVIVPDDMDVIEII